MKFNDLVDYILNEAGGVDPMKFAYKGAPMGYRKDTGVSNPEKFVPTSPSRKMYDVASVPQNKRAKSADYITSDVNRILRAALLVTAADPEAGTELKRVLENFAKIYHEYRAADQHSKRVYDVWEKLRNKDTEYAQELKSEYQEYMKIAGQWKTKAEELTPETLDAIQDLVKEGGQNFVNKLGSESLKSLDELNIEDIPDDTDKRTVDFLKDVWKGKSEFKPLLRFVENERQEGKNPLPRLLTIYKSVIDLMVRNNLVGSPERTLNYLTGLTGKVRTIAEPTKGKVEMKKKDPAVFQVANLIKKGKYQDAKQAVNNTKLDNAAKADLMIKIDKLSKGEMSEADVIRPLYQ